MRVSGPHAGVALRVLVGALPLSRRAVLRRVRNSSGAVLDQALILWLPGPHTVTGEDIAELHLHGGRAVVASVLAALDAIPHLRPAVAGEFTRRGFENGRIDLAEAEGLSDLLTAETESQRQSALLLVEGGLGRKVGEWQAALLNISARIEAELDFSDEGDVAPVERVEGLWPLIEMIEAMLAAPPAERLKDGVKVVLAGPPNTGKSSLFNTLVNRDAAIVSEIAGTTRDRIEAPILLGGIPFIVIDTAGLRDSDDTIEAIGIARAQAAVASADIIMWLGDAAKAPVGALIIAAKADLGGQHLGLPVSIVTGQGVDALKTEIITRARRLLPKPGALALNARHRTILADVLINLQAAMMQHDLLITAEYLRLARIRLDALTGRAGVEDMLDALFGAFCIGK